jgi:hypothetical protein
MTWLEYHELTKHSPINPSVYPQWRTTSGTRELLSTRMTAAGSFFFGKI